MNAATPLCEMLRATLNDAGLRHDDDSKGSTAFICVYLRIQSRCIRLGVGRMRDRAELLEAVDGRARAVEGSGRLGGGATEGRGAAGQVVGSVQRSGAERPRSARRGFETDSRRSRGTLPPGARRGAIGALAALPDFQ